MILRFLEIIEDNEWVQINEDFEMVDLNKQVKNFFSPEKKLMGS